MKTKIQFRAYIQNMSRSDILDMISVKTYEEIKTRDPEPEFRAYIIGQEGEADAKLLGKGRQIFKYFRDVITKMLDRVTVGVKAFEGHAQNTNSHENRNSIGEIVGKTLKNIDNKLTAIAAIYINSRERKKKLDIASIEADVLYERLDNNTVKVTDIEEITGIALGNSDIESPGFPAAKLLGAVQALSVRHNRKSQTEDKVTKDEIIQAVKEGKFKPSDIYTIDELTSDSKIADHIKKEKQTEYEHAKRIEKKLGEEREGFIKKETEFTEQINKLKKENAKSGLNDLFKVIADERKLNDKQKQFVLRKIDSFESEKTEKDELKLDLNKFVDKQIEDFNETAKLMGIKIEDQKKDEKQDQIQTPPTDDLNKGDKSDLTKPENNPFIPTKE